MTVEKNQRELEAGIHTDLQGRLTTAATCAWTSC